MYTLKFQSVCEIADFGDVFKLYAYFVNNRLFLTTARLVGDCLTMDVQRMDIQRLPSFEVMIVTAT